MWKLFFCTTCNTRHKKNETKGVKIKRKPISPFRSTLCLLTVIVTAQSIQFPTWRMCMHNCTPNIFWAHNQHAWKMVHFDASIPALKNKAKRLNNLHFIPQQKANAYAEEWRVKQSTSPILGCARPLATTYQGQWWSIFSTHLQTREHTFTATSGSNKSVY